MASCNTGDGAPKPARSVGQACSSSEKDSGGMAAVPPRPQPARAAVGGGHSETRNHEEERDLANAKDDVGGSASEPGARAPPLPRRSQDDYRKPPGRPQCRKLGAGTGGAVELRLVVSDGVFAAVKFPNGGPDLWREADVAAFVHKHPHPNVLAPLFYTGDKEFPSSLAFPVQMGTLAAIRNLSGGILPKPFAKP